MSSAELLRLLRRLARRKGIAFLFEAGHGKGSHGRVTVGPKRTTLPRADDLKPGTLHSILKDLGLTERDLR